MPAKTKDENRRIKLLRKVFEKIKESKWGTSYKSIRIKHSWNTSYILYMIPDSELARTFESKNHIKNETIRHRVMENECIWEGILLMNACWVSQSVSVLSSFKCSPMMVCLKKMFNGEIICHLKRRLKRLCYYKWKAWYT